MAKQTQREKLLDQINAARQAGILTVQEAKALRDQVKSNSSNGGNVAQGVGRAVTAAIAAADRDRGRPDGPPTGPVGQPPGPAPEGQEWVWDGDKWALQDVPFVFDPDSPELNTDIPGYRPPDETGPGTPPYPAPEGFFWQLGPDGKTWILKQVPSQAPPDDGAAERDRDKKNREGAKFRLAQLLRQYGIITAEDESMLKTINDLVEEWGSNNDSVIMSYLRESEPYKKRFKGNQDRIKAGYSVLSEAEYIAYEDQIKKKMRGFGLDDAFYSSERLADLIGYDVSGDEVADRLTKAKRIVDSADPNIKNSLVSLYGASLGDLIGYVLDPKLAAEGLQRKINAGVAYGVAQGYDLQLDRDLSEQIGELTYGDERTARQALGTAGELARNVRKLKNIDTDIDLTDADVVEQQFGLDAEAGRKVKKLQSRERARFTGSSGAFAGTLSDSSGY